MMLRLSTVVSILLLFGCKTEKASVVVLSEKSHFTIAFGSCNKHDSPNLLWDDIQAENPDVWIWGGDIVYADTDDMVELRRVYKAQSEVVGYTLTDSEIPLARYLTLK